ncbi:Rhodanese-like protein [Choiromyces venosus 120613-1]|uniref:Rhodanese-like protein n=1 Tax=Choiromyces venosus 120613-1 TaxID=1336337 RepID=A0A3N4KBC6_9PEZI|nr:Rhodanese-like protein [Choiromyces venosus 120613-1]
MASKRLSTLIPRFSTSTPIIRRCTITPTLHHHHRPQFQTTLQQSHSKKYSTSPNTKLYDYEAIKSLATSPHSKATLIDVREPGEFASGAIPTAINLPIASSPDALTLSPEDFEDRFGFAKPSFDEEVVFYCKAGIRSSAAAQVAVGVGYRKVGEYRGSWVDWERREKGV